ncbi:MAG: DUF5012 domain-containing protein [Bacteroidales bacterium]|nr:DUF5012 domain-containing protein [Bacteroidales bacterium]
MKKLYIYLLAALPLLSGCSKDSEDHSFITDYASISVEGDDYIFVNYGDDYVEPGVTATIAGEDVSSQLKINNPFQKNTYGKFDVSYSITNADGYQASASRTIIVLDPSSQVKQGFVTIHNTRDGVEENYDNEVLFYSLGEGNFAVTDLIGGFYAQGRGYGDAYALSGVINIADDGTISLVNAGSTSFGGTAEEVTGVYDVANGTFKISTSYLGYGFNMELQ